MNLPTKFIEKLIDSNFNRAIVLVNNAADTKWFAKLISKAAAIVFHTRRVKFYTPDGNIGASLQGQSVIYFGGSNENPGVIQNRKRAAQIIDFSGIRFNNITPTDSDGEIEYHDKAWIFIEIKYRDSDLPFGQPDVL